MHESVDSVSSDMIVDDANDGAAVRSKQRLAGTSRKVDIHDEVRKRVRTSEVEMNLDNGNDATTTNNNMDQNSDDPDEVLIKMIQSSGAQSYEQVVQFCVDTGIPLSRMLRLDLMRLIRHTTAR